MMACITKSSLVDKWQYREGIKLIDEIFVLTSPEFLKKHDISKAGSISIYQAKKHLTWQAP